MLIFAHVFGDHIYTSIISMKDENSSTLNVQPTQFYIRL